MASREPLEPVDQPIDRKGLCNRHAQQAFTVLIQQRPGGDMQVIEHNPHRRQIQLTFPGEVQLALVPVEQEEPKPLFQQLDLVTYCPLGDKQFLRCARETAMPGRGFNARTAFSGGKRRGEDRFCTDMPCPGNWCLAFGS